MRRNFFLLLCIVAIVFWGCVSCDTGKPFPETEAQSPAAGQALDPADWLTRAEASNFTATSNYEETLTFLRRLEVRLPEMKLTSFGVSGQGREMPLVVLSKDRAFTPAKAGMTSKPIVMIQNGIHPGEIDGKDACLMILRDLALGERQWILDAAVLLIVPIYNVDGHERISVFNRPNQDGPEAGMGFRTTAGGLDLNRDHLKIVSPEARALIGLFNAWRPDIHVDNHVTDGSEHEWVLTTICPEAPQAAPGVDAWLKKNMPVVFEATREAGHPNGPYIWLVDRADPLKGIRTWSGAPRYSTGYYPLRNRPSILVETHSYKPFKKRVLATRDFLIALIKQVGEDGRALRKAVTNADREIMTLGRPDAGPSQLVLQYGLSKTPDSIVFPICDFDFEDSVVVGGPLIRYHRDRIRREKVPWFHEPEAVKTIARPRGYLVHRGWPQIETRLRGHGLRVEELTRAAEVTVETARLADPNYAKAPYQGLTRVEIKVERREETRKFPAGTLWIPADQPDFQIAAQLLEPDADDSLFRWGLISSVFERKEYIDTRVLERLVKEMMKDPAIAAQWKEALGDEAFAKDTRRRWLWWYKKTDHWDETVGLSPAMRLMTAPDFETKTW